jgi:hypothetical protein
MFSEMKDMLELKEYLQAQQKTIVQQQKRIAELETEVQRLKVAPDRTVTLLDGGNSLISVQDEESIAKMELKKLRDASLARELTMEEARKVEIYAKLLLQLKGQKQNKVPDTKTKSSAELLSLVEQEENAGS